MDSKLAPVSEREGKLKELLRDEETKKNINDSKFRAVAQKMDYEGFRQMVLRQHRAQERRLASPFRRVDFRSGFHRYLGGPHRRQRL